MASPRDESHHQKKTRLSSKSHCQKSNKKWPNCDKSPTTKTLPQKPSPIYTFSQLSKSPTQLLEAPSPSPTAENASTRQNPSITKKRHANSLLPSVDSFLTCLSQPQSTADKPRIHPQPLINKCQWPIATHPQLID